MRHPVVIRQENHPCQYQTPSTEKNPGPNSGICIKGGVPFPFRVALKPARGLGSAVSSPAGPGAEPQRKTNLVHCKAVRKPLVAIILSILKCMFYSCHLSGVP